METKFRGKRIDNGEWAYGFLVKNYIFFETACPMTYYGETVFGEGEFIEVYPDSVGMWTTQHDADGKEIWENDFAEIHWDDDEVEVYLIDWSEWGFSTESCSYLPESESLRVIGNTTDDPGLLGVKQ